MSRAFVRETDFPQLPELPSQVSPLPPGTKNYLTPAGAARLRAELKRRLDGERPRLAAAAPDDSDSKRELQTLDRRIRYLQEGLRSAEIVELPAIPDDVVRFGATVTVRDRDGESRYRIVGVDEADSARGDISWLSPLARALLNARRGEQVTFKTPAGTTTLEIASVTYDPASGPSAP